MNLIQNSELIWPKLISFNETSLENDTGQVEKFLAMVVLGFGSFIAGVLPAFISERNRQRFPLTTSLMLCFGAGILLATALIHILPEVRIQINSNWAEISLCAGFFVIYFVDEFIHYFFGKAIQHSHGNHHDNHNTQTNAPTEYHNYNYGALDNSESESLLSSIIVQQQQQEIGESDHNHSHQNNNNDTEPCSQSMTGTLGLFVALSLHSIIEGLAIGVQNSSAKVLFLLGAVACHKFVMGFCLGLEFRSNPQTRLKSQIIGISVFALGAITGIALGMIIVDVPSTWSTTALPVIQGLAGGTLLYVTVCEVIPREKAKWHKNLQKRSAGFAQFLAMAIGFIVMCVINFYFNDDA